MSFKHRFLLVAPGLLDVAFSRSDAHDLVHEVLVLLEDLELWVRAVYCTAACRTTGISPFAE